MPVREKRSRRAGSRPARPLSRPQPHADPAKVRGLSPTAPRFTAETDSALEGAGFEHSVPHDVAGSAVSRRLSAYRDGPAKNA